MKTLASVLGTLLLAVCAQAQEVSFNYDDQADFAKYKTFRWEQHPDSIAIDELVKKQLAEVFTAELAKKGLTETKNDNADLVITYQIAISQERQITSYNSTYGYGPGWRGRWYGPGGVISETTIDTIKVGSIDLDIFDAANKQLIWRGVATKTIDEKANPEKRKKNMAKAAEKLLKNFPPKKKK